MDFFGYLGPHHVRLVELERCGAFQRSYRLRGRREGLWVPTRLANSQVGVIDRRGRLPLLARAARPGRLTAQMAPTP